MKALVDAKVVRLSEPCVSECHVSDDACRRCQGRKGGKGGKGKGGKGKESDEEAERGRRSHTRSQRRWHRGFVIGVLGLDFK